MRKSIFNIEKKTTYNHTHNHTDSDSIRSGGGLCGGR